MRSGGLLPVLSACRSLSCPMMGRYGSGSSVPLPPVGSVERSQVHRVRARPRVKVRVRVRVRDRDRVRVEDFVSRCLTPCAMHAVHGNYARTYTIHVRSSRTT